MSLKCPYAGHIQLVKRPAANAADNNGVNMMAAKPRNRVTCAMLMELVAVIDRRYLAGDHIHDDKFRCRAKMPIHLT